ncbi:MAG: TonB-dependent receptor, partial [Bacteroidales bacterium]|nr:TonB-dependent receptor [Bacteroidales bacterium]
MMKRKLFVLFLLCLGFTTVANAQAQRNAYTIKGVVYESDSKTPIEMALVNLPDLNLWATTNSKGEFVINKVFGGSTRLEITCLGYQKLEMKLTVEKNLDNLAFKLNEDNLKLETVVVTAQENRAAMSTSTKMDRQAIDHLQVINPTDIMSLMPGGKTVNPNLMTQSIFTLRGGDGNGSFGTAVEVDGVRLSSNSSMTGLSGVDTRNLSASNFESVEVITGVPSVEYG